MAGLRINHNPSTSVELFTSLVYLVDWLDYLFSIYFFTNSTIPWKRANAKLPKMNRQIRAFKPKKSIHRIVPAIFPVRFPDGFAVGAVVGTGFAVGVAAALTADLLTTDLL